jgi:hypothetical protein
MADDIMQQLPMSEDEFKDLMTKVKEAEAGNAELHEVAGVSREELQDFLENKAGLAPEEEGLGTPLAAAVSIAYHC